MMYPPQSDSEHERQMSGRTVDRRSFAVKNTTTEALSARRCKTAHQWWRWRIVFERQEYIQALSAVLRSVTAKVAEEYMYNCA